MVPVAGQSGGGGSSGVGGRVRRLVRRKPRFLVGGQVSPRPVLGVGCQTVAGCAGPDPDMNLIVPDTWLLPGSPRTEAASGGQDGEGVLPGEGGGSLAGRGGIERGTCWPGAPGATWGGAEVTLGSSLYQSMSGLSSKEPGDELWPVKASTPVPRELRRVRSVRERLEAYNEKEVAMGAGAKRGMGKTEVLGARPKQVSFAKAVKEEQEEEVYETI